MPPYKKHVVVKRAVNKVSYTRKLPYTARLRPSGSNSHEHPFEHTVTITIPYAVGATGITGFQLPSTTAATDNPGLRWTFSPVSCNVFNANSGTNGATVGNSAYYIGIFERFRLDKVTIKAFWQVNNPVIPVNLSTSVQLSPTVLPVLQTAFDPEVSAATPTSVGTLLDYPSLSTCQMGTSAVSRASGASMDRTFYPSIGVTATSPSQAFMPKGTWLSVDQGNYPVYCGTLMYADLQGQELVSTPSNFVIGYMTFYVKLYSKFKGIR